MSSNRGNRRKRLADPLLVPPPAVALCSRHGRGTHLIDARNGLLLLDDLKGVDIDDKQLDRLEGMVHSMTPAERDDIKLLNKSRVKRIAKGSGSTTTDVNKLTKQFEMMQKVTKQMAGGGMGGRLKAMREMAKGGGDMVPGMANMPALGARGSTKTVGVKSKFKQRKKRR